jgi:DNA polymerase type B, organellar and viral.
MLESKWLKSKDYKSDIKNTNDLAEPLNPRFVFYGGRTNASKLKVQNKILRYFYICSLYPPVQYFDYYPVGQPKKIHKPEKYDKDWHGLIKCKILPPKKFYHPMLLIKKDKLISTLCTKCFDEKCNNGTHNDEERALLGTWTTEEVFKAVKNDMK